MKTPVNTTVWIIWGALFMAVFTYSFMLLSMNRASVESASSLGSIFAMLAVTNMFVSLVIRKIMLGGFKKKTLSLDSVEGQRRFVSGNVICFALSESIAVLGLILGLQGASIDTWGIFMVAAIFMLLLHVPFARRFTPEPDERTL
jgi:hypothetical protein